MTQNYIHNLQIHNFNAGKSNISPMIARIIQNQRAKNLISTNNQFSRIPCYVYGIINKKNKKLNTRNHEKKAKYKKT